MPEHKKRKRTRTKTVEVAVGVKVDPATFPLDRYKPMLITGRGASGVVYICKDMLLGIKVAVKCLHYFDAEQFVEFQKEARATSKLQHSGIVKVLDFGATKNGAPYMVMENVVGISLHESIHEHGLLSTGEAVEIFSQICDALGYAHSKGVFHRDIKGANIIVTKRTNKPQVHIIDFGLALSKNNQQETTIVNGIELVGTPAYMAPEQLSGAEYDARSEIYSVGCLLYEALTGETPFQANNPMDMLNKHNIEAPKSLYTFNHKIDYLAEVEAVLAQCLAKQPSGRYLSMAALKKALQAIGTKDATVDGASMPELQTSKPAAKAISIPPGIFIGAAIVTIAVCIGSVLLSLTSDKPAAEPAIEDIDMASVLPEKEPLMGNFKPSPTVGSFEEKWFKLSFCNYQVFRWLDARLTKRHLDGLIIEKGIFGPGSMKPIHDVSIDRIDLDGLDEQSMNHLFAGLTPATSLKKLHVRLTAPESDFYRLPNGAFHTALTNQPIEELLIVCAGPIDTPSFEQFINDISTSLLQTLVLREMDCEDVPPYPDETFEALAKLQNLTTLGISSERLTETGITGLEKLKKLKKLILVGERTPNLIAMGRLQNELTCEVIVGAEADKILNWPTGVPNITPERTKLHHFGTAQ